MIIVFSALLFLYCIMLGMMLWGWNMLKKNPGSPKISTLPHIGVIIPVRNERDNILNLLDDLERQDYPKDLYEAIVIDDRSDDGTSKVILKNKERFSFSLKVISLPDRYNSGSTKKKAIELGVRSSAGKYILTTDGDCRVPEGWISAFAGRFIREDVNFLAGMVAFNNCQNLFQKVQAAEFAALTGVAAASMRLGFPIMCNAANMAFRRQTFLDIGGFRGVAHIVSGDDGFLLEKFSALDRTKVRFLKDKKAIVRTSPQKTAAAFFHQRKRWASKWKNHANPTTIAAAVFIFLFHAAFLISLFLTIAGIYPAPVLIVQWAIKIFFELTFLRKVYRFLDQRLSFVAFSTLEMAYSFYTVFFGIAANFGGFTWKGRKYVDLARIKTYER